MACCWNGWSSTTSTERSIAVRSPFFSNLNTGERANSFSMTSICSPAASVSAIAARSMACRPGYSSRR